MALLPKESCNLRHSMHLGCPVAVARGFIIFPQKSHLIRGSFAENELQRMLTSVHTNEKDMCDMTHGHV